MNLRSYLSKSEVLRFKEHTVESKLSVSSYGEYNGSAQITLVAKFDGRTYRFELTIDEAASLQEGLFGAQQSVKVECEK